LLLFCCFVSIFDAFQQTGFIPENFLVSLLSQEL